MLYKYSSLLARDEGNNDCILYLASIWIAMLSMLMLVPWRQHYIIILVAWCCCLVFFHINGCMSYYSMVANRNQSRRDLETSSWCGWCGASSSRIWAGSACSFPLFFISWMDHIEIFPTILEHSMVLYPFDQTRRSWHFSVQFFVRLETDFLLWISI